MEANVKKKVLVFLLLLLSNSAFAQTKAPILVRTPFSHHSQPTPSVHSSVNPDVNSRMQKDMEQIQEDLHSGKLSEAEATALRNKVKGVRKRELGFFKANGRKTLSESQKNQLGQDLAEVEPSI
jgi:hypothetical protein